MSIFTSVFYFYNRKIIHSHVYSARGIPVEWKTARILPLFKSGDRLNIKNYPPIANLCSLGKIFEKMVLHKLDAETSNMEGVSQHGFRCNHSTLTAALELQTAIASSLDDKKMGRGLLNRLKRSI